MTRYVVHRVHATVYSTQSIHVINALLQYFFKCVSIQTLTQLHHTLYSLPRTNTSDRNKTEFISN